MKEKTDRLGVTMLKTDIDSSKSVAAVSNVLTTVFLIYMLLEEG